MQWWKMDILINSCKGRNIFILWTAKEALSYVIIFNDLHGETHILQLVHSHAHISINSFCKFLERNLENKIPKKKLFQVKNWIYALKRIMKLQSMEIWNYEKRKAQQIWNGYLVREQEAQKAYKYSGILQILLENVLVRYKSEIVIKILKRT